MLKYHQMLKKRVGPLLMVSAEICKPHLAAKHDHHGFSVYVTPCSAASYVLGASAFLAMCSCMSWNTQKDFLQSRRRHLACPWDPLCNPQHAIQPSLFCAFCLASATELHARADVLQRCNRRYALHDTGKLVPVNRLGTPTDKDQPTDYERNMATHEVRSQTFLCFL